MIAAPLSTVEHLGNGTPQAAGIGDNKPTTTPQPAPAQKTEDTAAYAKRLLHEFADEDPLPPAISGSLFSEKWRDKLELTGRSWALEPSRRSSLPYFLSFLSQES